MRKHDVVVRITGRLQESIIGGSKLREAIRRGDLEASKLGDSPRSPVVVTHAAIERWLESHRVEPQAD